MLELKRLKNNQYMITSNRFIFFVSYETFICAYDTYTRNLLIFDYIKKLYVSRTTATYLKQYLDEVNLTFKNFREEIPEVKIEIVYFRKLEKASQYEYDYNVKYVSDYDVEKLFTL